MRLSRPWIAGILFLSLYTPQAKAQTVPVTVTWNKVYQQIDGFGASDAFDTGSLTVAQGELFFSPVTGIGLSLLRTNVPEDGSCSTINATCAGEVSDMQMAIANGARVWSTPWSPPAAMKTNNAINDGGYLLPASYQPYANYLANYVESLRNLFGINLYAVSVQNEPDGSHHWDSALWTPANFATFIGTNLGPTFAADGLSTLIMMPEPPNFYELSEFMVPTMSNATAAGYVGLIATHDYDPSNTQPAYPVGHGRAVAVVLAAAQHDEERSELAHDASV